MTCFMIPV